MAVLPDTEAGFAHRSRLAPSCLPRPVGRLVHHAVPLLQGRDLFNIYFRPSLPAPAYASAGTPAPPARGRSGFALHTVTGLHRPELHHYYGVICHLAPITALACALSTDALS